MTVLNLTAEDLETIREYGPATPPTFPDECALCRTDMSGMNRVHKGPGGFLIIDGEDFYLCRQCVRRAGIPE